MEPRTAADHRRAVEKIMHPEPEPVPIPKAERGRNWDDGPELTEAEKVRARDARMAREIRVEQFSEIDPVTGQRRRSTWEPA